MKKVKFIIALTLLLAGIYIQPAHAFIVFSDRDAFDAAFPGTGAFAGSVVEDWDFYGATYDYSNIIDHGTIIPNGSMFKGITYNTNNANSAQVTGYYLGTSWHNTLGETGLGYFGGNDTITFQFSNPLTAFGLDINAYALNANAFTATLSNGHVIGSSYNPFPGFSTGQFIGFSDDAFDSVTITSNDHYAYTLDTMRAVDAPTTVVPEPSTVSLLAFGLFGLALFGIKQRKFVGFNFLATK